MKYAEAQQQLRHAINNQQTISTKKLARILQSMNISLKHNNLERQEAFLKGVNKR